MRFLFFILGVIACRLLPAQMPVYGADSLLKHYKAKADELLVGDSSLYNWFAMDIYGIRMYSSPIVKAGDNPSTEYRVTWQELPTYKNVMAFETRESAMNILLEMLPHM